MLGGDQPEVVDPGRCGRGRWQVGAGVGMDVTPDPLRDGGSHRSALVAHLQGGQVERVEHDLDPASDQGGVDLVGVAVQARRGGLGDPAGVGPQERLVQQFGGRRRGWAGGQEPFQRFVAGLAVDPLVVDGLDPGGEQLVQPGQVAHGCRRAGRGELDEELLAHGPEQTLDLAPAGRLAGLGMGQLDTEHGQCPQQLGGHHRRAVVEVDDLGYPTAGQARTQGRLEPDGVLAVAPPVADQGPAVVVDEREQERLTAGDHRAVEGVTGPPIVRGGGLEPPERLGRRPVGAGVELRTGEVPLQRPRRRHRAARTGMGPEDRGDLRRGPGRDLALERRRQLQHRSGRDRFTGTHRGQQRLEPPTPPRQDPPVQGDPRDLDPLPGRAGVLASGEVADQPAPGPGRQLRVGGLPDQGVPEQGDVPRPIGPAAPRPCPVVVMSCSGTHPVSSSSVITL